MIGREGFLLGSEVGHIRGMSHYKSTLYRYTNRLIWEVWGQFQVRSRIASCHPCFHKHILCTACLWSIQPPHTTITLTPPPRPNVGTHLNWQSSYPYSWLDLILKKLHRVKFFELQCPQIKGNDYLMGLMRPSHNLGGPHMVSSRKQSPTTYGDSDPMRTSLTGPIWSRYTCVTKSDMRPQQSQTKTWVFYSYPWKNKPLGLLKKMLTSQLKKEKSLKNVDSIHHMKFSPGWWGVRCHI